MIALTKAQKRLLSFLGVRMWRRTQVPFQDRTIDALAEAGRITIFLTPAGKMVRRDKHEIIRCDRCNGRGALPNAWEGYDQCTRCNASGMVIREIKEQQ